MKTIDLTQEITLCPYCGEEMYYHSEYIKEYHCPDCRVFFSAITGKELDSKGNDKEE